jgi:hypothetical protein
MNGRAIVTTSLCDGQTPISANARAVIFAYLANLDCPRKPPRLAVGGSGQGLNFTLSQNPSNSA